MFSAGCGRAAALVLAERVAVAKLGDPLRPVAVVVRSNYAGVAVRRLLASGGLGSTTGRAGVAGLSLLTVDRLAELLGGPRLAAAGRRPVSAPVIGAAVRRVLREQPGLFAPAWEHPATEEALVRSYRELSTLRAESLDLLASQSDRAAEVVRVRRAVRALLEPGWFDQADLLGAAGQALVEGSLVLGDLGLVVLYLPQELSPPAAELVRCMAERTEVEVVAGRTGSSDADADVDLAVRRLGLEPATEPVEAPRVRFIPKQLPRRHSPLIVGVQVQGRLGIARRGPYAGMFVGVELTRSGDGWYVYLSATNPRLGPVRGDAWNSWAETDQDLDEMLLDLDVEWLTSGCKAPAHVTNSEQIQERQ